MRTHNRQSGLTLTELMVTIAIAAILMAVAVPAAKRLTASLRDTAGSRGLISAALSNARAIAARNGKDAGIWFQKNNDDRMVMTFIVYDYEMTGLANGFRVVEGRKPVLLPEGIVVVGHINDGWQDSVFPIVFTPAGKMAIRNVRYGGNLERPSVSRFRISEVDTPANSTTLMISPYSGELVGD